MRFFISDKKRHEMISVDINNYFKLYLETKHINMEAGGYMLGSQVKQWNPIAVSFEKEVSILFETSEEARSFADWIVDLNKQSNESYTRMLD